MRGQETPLSRFLLLQLLLVVLYAAAWRFAFVPWLDSVKYDEQRIRMESFNAYVAMTRHIRPVLADAVRGLNLGGEKFEISRQADIRCLSFGNVRLLFDGQGKFIDLETLP